MNKKLVKNNLLLVKVICFGFIFYVISSLLEYYVHKYIMHCNVNGKLNQLLKSSILTRGAFSDLCDHHLKHHKEVKPDMKLSCDELEGAEGLFMTWSVVFYLVIILCIFLFPINYYIFKFKIVNVFMLIVIASLFWCYL